MKRFAVNMLTVLIVLAIGCLFLFSGTGCSDGKSHEGTGGMVQHVTHHYSHQAANLNEPEGLDQGFDLPETDDTTTEEQ